MPELTGSGEMNPESAGDREQARGTLPNLSKPGIARAMKVATAHSPSIHVLLFPVGENVPRFSWGQGHPANEFIFQPQGRAGQHGQLSKSVSGSDWCTLWTWTMFQGDPMPAPPSHGLDGCA